MTINRRPTNEAKEEKRKVTVRKDGPYLVSGAIPLSEESIGADAEGYSSEWCEGKQYPPQANYTLCRCGQSGTKPYCDGTHVKIGFDGTETASREPYINQAENIDGPDLVLGDAKALCAEARFCERAGGIWNLTRQSDQPESRSTAVEEAANCPSGRLVVWDKTGAVIEPDLEPSIVLTEDPQEGVSGPIWVRGGVMIESSDGTPYETRNRVALCRCGKSSNKPFCDGSHRLT